jgi:hypothetical protein
MTTLVLIPLLAFAAVLLAGASLRRKGRWTQRTFLLSVGAMAVLCAIAAAVALLAK